MSGSNPYYVSFSAADLYYLAAASNTFLYGYLVILCIGFVGNICQILTFSRATMRNVSTGVLFLALSISDILNLLLSSYVMIIYGFKVSDKSNLAITCRLRHFTSYLTTNFSAWMLTLSKSSLAEIPRVILSYVCLVSFDRWIRTRFPHKAQRLCTPRTAIYSIIVALMLDILLHVHILTPLFGPIPPGSAGPCGPNQYYPPYVYFYTDYWPVITMVTVTLLPAALMVFFLLGIIIKIQAARRRIVPLQLTTHEKRRSRFIHRQMFILMIVTLILFFISTLPVALFRFILSTAGVKQAFSISLLLAGVFGVITTSNNALNFYLHSLTSKLFRREFLRAIPCSISIRVNGKKNNAAAGIGIQRCLSHAPQGTITQIIGHQSHTTALEKPAVTPM